MSDSKTILPSCGVCEVGTYSKCSRRQNYVHYSYVCPRDDTQNENFQWACWLRIESFRLQLAERDKEIEGLREALEAILGELGPEYTPIYQLARTALIRKPHDRD